MMGFLSFLIVLSCNNFQNKKQQLQKQLLQQSGKKLHASISTDLTNVRIKPSPAQAPLRVTRIATSRQFHPKRAGSCSPKAAAPVASTSRARSPTVAPPVPSLFIKNLGGRGREAGVRGDLLFVYIKQMPGKELKQNLP